MEDKTYQLIQVVTQKTLAGDLDWSETFDDDEFRRDVADWRLIIARHQPDPYEQELGPSYGLKFCAGDSVVEEISQGDIRQYRDQLIFDTTNEAGAEAEDAPNLEQLFAAARRSAFGFEGAVDRMIKELGGD